MPDREFSQAFGYEKSAPIFNFIKDSNTGNWRPMTSADVAQTGGGGGGVTVDVRNLEQIQISGNLLQQQGNTAILQTQADLQIYNQKCSYELSLQVPQFNYINIYSVQAGTVTRTQGANFQKNSIDDSVSTGVRYYSIPTRFYNQNYTKMKSFDSHQIGIQVSSQDTGQFDQANDYFKVFSIPSRMSQQAQFNFDKYAYLVYSGQLENYNVFYRDTFSQSSLIIEVKSSKKVEINYDSFNS